MSDIKDYYYLDSINTSLITIEEVIYTIKYTIPYKISRPNRILNTVF
jgi:hypothetical protein